MAHVTACEASQPCALMTANRGFGQRHVMRGAGLYLNEAQQVTLPSDQVDIAWDVTGRPATRNDGVSLAAQIEEGGVFAGISGRLVCRHVRFGAAAPGSAIQPGERALQ